MGGTINFRSISESNCNICIKNNIFPIYDEETKLFLQENGIGFRKIKSSDDIKFRGQEGSDETFIHPLKMEWINPNPNMLSLRDICNGIQPTPEKISADNFLHIIALPTNFKLKKDKNNHRAYHLCENDKSLYIIAICSCGTNNEISIIKTH